MKQISKYLNFIRERGKKLSYSDSRVLTTEDAFEAIELLKGTQLAILGGDPFSEDDNGELGLIIHLWDAKYCCFIWNCEKMDGETTEDYINRSYEVAKEYIAKVNNEAIHLNKKCYFFLVVSGV